MQSLLDLQRDFARCMLHGDDASRAPWVLGDDRAAQIALSIHRNNIEASLGAALAEMFPVVRRLVGDGFFAFAAHEFIRTHPPCDARVDEFGAFFADFLAAFAPARDLAYLPDVARLERLLHDAARVSDDFPIDPESVARLAEADATRLIFDLRASFAYLASSWPVAAIWRANQADQDGTIPRQSGGSSIEVCRRNGVVEFRELAPSVFAMRAALARGSSLADALEAAVSCDETFDAPTALADLFADGAVSGAGMRSEDPCRT